MAHPSDALHFREVFGRHMRRPDAGYEQAFYVTPAHEDQARFEAMIENVQHHVYTSLDHGETFYVSPEITEILLKHAAHLATRRLMHFEADDFPALAGTVYFDGRVVLPTVLDQSHEQRLVAVVWGQMARDRNTDAEVVGKIMYSVAETTPLQKTWTPHPFPWRLRHWMPVTYDERMDPQHVNHAPAPSEEILGRLGDIRKNMTPEMRKQDDEDSQVSASLIMRLMLVWGRFLKTEIMARTTWDVDRQHRKIMGKEGRPVPQIRIVTLRRYASVNSEDLGNIVDWTHRWKVRGHYRMQRVGPGRAMYQRVWVAPCIKGPAHLPLIERDTVIAVTR